MTDDPQNIGPLLTGLGARRIGVDHYTEHDFEMERVGRKQNAETYAERLKILEGAGWVPFSCPFYYADREFHGGHFAPGTEKHLPTKVAFAMFREANPEVELPAYKPHPHGWTRPTAEMPFKTELVSVEPMKVPAGALFALADSYEYGTEEEKTARREKKARMDAVFKDLPGIRVYGTGTHYGKGPARDYLYVKLEAEEFRAALPETWEGLAVEVTVESEAQERAEKEAKDKAFQATHDEEAAWMAKASRV